MIYIRKSHERGRSRMDWLESSHTFSFASYYDPQFMGFGHLRVINEDIVQEGNGFGRHPHNNMEIISYVIDGSLEHKDSMGTGSTIKPGEIQLMSAGTGVEHSEFNHSKTDKVHFLQIWIIPDEKGLTPRYEQKTIQKSDNKLILIGSKNISDNTVTIHQDVELYAAYLTANHSVEHQFKNGRSGWLQLIKGKITLNEHELFTGDGAAITQTDKISVNSIENAELLLFELG
jgi:redox-sensitive bicupin YhaK (pirin superfamily)